MVVYKRSTYIISISIAWPVPDRSDQGTRLEIFYADGACGRVQVVNKQTSRGLHILAIGPFGDVTGDWLLRPRPPQNLCLCTPESGEPYT